MWWQLQPLAFLGAPTTLAEQDGVSHRLRRLEPWLDYAAHLGATGLLMGPIFRSGTHGYDTIDHFRIDPRLGDGSDFDWLISAAHDRGIRVMLDGVFNHVGKGFQPFIDARAGGTTGNWFDGRTFEGHDLLVTLNHDEPAVAGYVIEAMTFWLDRGADGWRLDAAYATPPEFWAGVLPAVRAKHPDARFVGEVIHGDYAAFVAASGMDSVTQYELWKAVWSSLNDGNFFELAAALERHNGYLKSFVPLTFIGNHDVTRIASKLSVPELLPLATALLFVLGGDPCVYAGDEQAFTGVKEDRVGGDDAIRPAFPATPDGLAPYGAGTFQLHQDLQAFRLAHPWLRTCASETLSLTNTAIVLRLGSLLLALNLDTAPVRLAVPGAKTLELGAPGQPSPVNGKLKLARLSWALLSLA